MPYVSDATLESIGSHVDRLENKARSTGLAEKLKTAEMVAIGEATLGAAVVGYARGRYQVGERFDVPRTTIPADFLAAAVVVGAGYFGKDKGGHLTALGTGALAGATAMYFERHGSKAKAAGKFWAGGDPQEIVGQLPDIVGEDEVGNWQNYRKYLSWAQRHRGRRWAGSMDDAKLAEALRTDQI